MALSDIVDADITRVSAAVTQQGFSTPLILAYHTRRVSDRVRSYTSPDEMTDDGYTPDDVAYKLAQILWSQPRPRHGQDRAPRQRLYALDPAHPDGGQ